VVTGVAVLALFFGGAARADVIFNNFGPGDSYTTNQGWTISGPTGAPPGFVQGDAFSIPAGPDLQLDRIRLAVGHVTGPNQVIVTLRADAGGLPGAVLETFNFTNLGAFGQNNPPLSADSVLHPLLHAGAQYWLIADPGNAATWDAWSLNTVNDVGPHAQSQGGGPFTENNLTRGAFEIFGSPAAVPEPATVTLLSTGALLLAGWRRWKGKRGPAAA
jgi:hypothetical protein